MIDEDEFGLKEKPLDRSKRLHQNKTQRTGRGGGVSIPTRTTYHTTVVGDPNPRTPLFVEDHL